MVAIHRLLLMWLSVECLLTCCLSGFSIGACSPNTDKKNVHSSDTQKDFTPEAETSFVEDDTLRDTETVAIVSTERGSDSIVDVNEPFIQKPDNCEHPEVIESCDNGWCRIAPGCFLYGTPPSEGCRAAGSEEQVYITLTHPFVIAQTEVTQEQWEAAGFSNPSFPPQCSDCPVSMVNWFEALAYCNALSAGEGLEKCYGLSCCEGAVGEGCEEGKIGCSDGYQCNCEVNRFENRYECPGYRLPTVAEWEYAAKAGTQTDTYIGDALVGEVDTCEPDPVVDRVAWACSNTKHAMPVALKEKNGWGLYDMLGNVVEWASDPYLNTAYGKGASHLIDPYGFIDGEAVNRPLRGCNFECPTRCVRSAFNLALSDFSKIKFAGLRPVRTLFE